jgi:hypothetical protein
VNGDEKGPVREPTERTKELSPFAFSFASKLYGRLKQENIDPPQWPAEPGNPNKRGAIEGLKDAYKKYRTRVYASLRKAELIDDPEKRRRLEDALPFKGICEDMCPEFEQVYRIAEHDVKTEEKEVQPGGLMLWPEPSRMVKKFARSAAGQDAPLPMDVRSVDALRRTTDYLFKDLLQSENNLPSMHNFLWDRTRAVRKDFTFHSQKTGEEMKDMVYCFETITRFHATALHLLSKRGVANEDFDQKQEIEQLGRTILSLMEAYDACRDKRVTCENEPEFRAYYLLFNAHDPSIAKRIPTWGKEYWFESEEMQTALSLVQAMDDVRERKGPIKPRRPTTLSDTSFANYFAIVEDPRVSYTMACIAEIHFTTVRQGILKNLVRSYARSRDAPRTITASDLNRMLRFDTDDEAVEFAELHGFEFSTWVPEGKNQVPEPYLLLNSKKKYVPCPRVRQSFSAKLVERKRTTQSLIDVIYNTIFEEPVEKSASEGGSPDGLFVSQAAPSETASSVPSATVKPPLPSSQPTGTPSPFSVAREKTHLPNGISPTKEPAGTAAPEPFGLQKSQPVSDPFGAPTRPATGSSAFGLFPGSNTSMPQSSSTASLTSTTKPPPSLNQPAQTTAPPPSTPEPSTPLGLSPFSKEATSTPAPLLPTVPSAQAASSPLATQDAASKPVPAASALVSSTSAPPAPSIASPFPSFPTTTSGKPTEPPPTPAVPAVPTISTSPASDEDKLVRKEPSQSIFPPAKPGISSPRAFPANSSSQTDASPAPRPATAPLKPQPPSKRDLMGDFTKWFVQGDGGLMEQFTDITLQEILWEAFSAFQREEEERKRREEDEESWRLARAHQAYRLQVKYFYRWRDAAHARATKRILREGKKKMRLYRAQQRQAQKQLLEAAEKAEIEARRAVKRQALENGLRLGQLADKARRRNSFARSSVDHVRDSHPEEEARLLLETGVFSGIGDERAHVQRVMREDTWLPLEPGRTFRYYPDSESELEFNSPSQPPRSVADETCSSAGGGDKKEGWKTRSLRERFGIDNQQRSSSRGRSVSASGSVNGGKPAPSHLSFRQSLPSSMPPPPTNKKTNFSRKRSADSDGDSEARKRLAVHDNLKASTVGSRPRSGSSTAPVGSHRSRHWELRARGLVPMPDGSWLPEAIAKHSPTPTTTSDALSDGGDDETELDMSEVVRSRGSPSPTSMQLRLERLKRSSLRAHAAKRGSFDLYSPGANGLGVGVGAGTRIGMDGFLSGVRSTTSTSTPARPERSLSAKRKREAPADGGRDVDGGEDEEDDRELSPPEAKKKATSVPVVGAAGAAPLGREETNAMVEDTRRMLRELKEFMDRIDQEGGGPVSYQV